MNENETPKKGNNKKVLDDYSVYFEELPPTIFRSKWLKNIPRKARRLKPAR